MFAIIFGLSLDYEIFLLSRVHEAWPRAGDARAAVAHPLEITARVISCAALIMVSVFAAFIISDNIIVKMLGLGLAVPHFDAEGTRPNGRSRRGGADRSATDLLHWKAS
jgi:RND superfamily putative drug exporter